MTDKEKERRYYQGPSERISLIKKTEYMTASQPILLKILNYLLQNRRSPYMTPFRIALYFSYGKTFSPKATRDYRPRSSTFLGLQRTMDKIRGFNLLTLVVNNFKFKDVIQVVEQINRIAA